ncbi:MAG: thiamine phosphate synthase [Polyangia bacterium]|jgi:thiamine-phosphate pyrophosphorylase
MSLAVQGYYAVLDLKGVELDLSAALAHAQRLLAARPCCLQLRAKNLPTAALCHLAHALRPSCRQAGVPLCINDRVDVALAVEADVVHLGQTDLRLADALRLRAAVLPRLKVAVSTHDLAQALAAEQGGADHIGFGPIFPTRSKDAGPSLGLAALRGVVGQVTIPIVAIGGISPANVDQVAAAGASAAAAIAAVDGAPDPTACGRVIAAAFTLSRPGRT